MILKWIKIATLSTAGVALVAGLLFGTDALSYVSSSARAVRTAVKDSVPIEFELQRAKAMLEDIIPQLHANVRLIAQEEVEVESLKTDIARCETSVTDERGRITRLRNLLNTDQARFTLAGYTYTRQQVKGDLAQRFDRFKEAEVILAGKHRLLQTREKSLQAAMDMLDRTRTEKVRLENQVEALESQYRLIQAASVGSSIQVDNSKLAQTEKLIRQIRKRLDVAERVLTHEARFVQPINVDTIDERDLLVQVDDYFTTTHGEASRAASTAPADTLELTQASPNREK